MRSIRLFVAAAGGRGPLSMPLAQMPRAAIIGGLSKTLGARDRDPELNFLNSGALGAAKIFEAHGAAAGRHGPLSMPLTETFAAINEESGALIKARRALDRDSWPKVLFSGALGAAGLFVAWETCSVEAACMDAPGDADDASNVSADDAEARW